MEEFIKEKEELEKEKREFLAEMELQNRRLLEEQKHLKEQELFFEKKMEILKGGFAQLEADRKAVEEERIRLDAERELLHSGRQDGEESIRLFFRGVSNPLTLKKRYKDLIKIFHPDNLCGDTDILKEINEMYELLQDEIGWQKKA